MPPLLTRRRLATVFTVLGVLLMAADLLITGSIFVHIAELMAASILSFIIALVLEHAPGTRKDAEPKPKP